MTDTGERVQQILVKPNSLRGEQVWKTKRELREDSRKPSCNFTDLSIGVKYERDKTPRKRLGTLQVELIEMRDVRAMDLLGKTDPFGIFIFEDNFFKTSVVDKELSPIYPAASNRAVKFQVTRPNASLYVGAFDYDAGISEDLDDDDPLGRVEIKISSMQPNTMYDMTYPLQDDKNTKASGELGYIRVRFCLDWEGNDGKILGLYEKGKNFHPVPLEIPNRKDYVCALFALHGKTDPDEYDWKTFVSYKDEIGGFFKKVKTVIKIILDIAFWENKFRSFVCFVVWQLLVIYPHYIPSAMTGIFLRVLWTQYHDQTSKRPLLHRVCGVQDILSTLVGGVFDPLEAPKEEEYTEEEEYIEEEEDGGETLPGLTEQSSEMDENDDKSNYVPEGEVEISEEELAFLTLKYFASEIKKFRKRKKPKPFIVTRLEAASSLLTLKVNPMASVLQPIQSAMKDFCIDIRQAENQFMWKDPYLTFGFVMKAVPALLIGPFMPYKILFTWGFRILGILLLGPQNKYFANKIRRNVYQVRKEKLNDLVRKKEKQCQSCLKRFNNPKLKAVSLHVSRCRRCADLVCSPCVRKMSISTPLLHGSTKGKIDETGQEHTVCLPCYKKERQVTSEEIEQVLLDTSGRFICEVPIVKVQRNKYTDLADVTKSFATLAAQEYLFSSSSKDEGTNNKVHVD